MGSENKKEEVEKAIERHIREGSKESYNSAYTVFAPLISRWVKTLAARKNITLDSGEDISLSWDCFEFCMRHYSLGKQIPAMNHFYAYTKFFFASWSSSEYRRTNNMQCENGEIRGYSCNPETYYGQIDDLKQFRSGLPENDKEIFDEAIMSMSGAPWDKVRKYDKTKPYTYYRYCEAKRVFKIVIDFLLRR